MKVSLIFPASAVIGVLVLPSPLMADALPSAPGRATPPILSEAKVWLDAWDYDTIQTDENGFVTNWLSKGDAAYNAKPYATAVPGKMGVTNGVPAFLMGDVGSGIDLSFKLLSNIRTVFWVMDTLPYIKNDTAHNAKVEHVNFLGCSAYDSHGAQAHYDFLRDGASQGVFNWTRKAFKASFWIGDTYLWSWEERRWAWRDNTVATTGLQVYALSSAEDLMADRLSAAYASHGENEGAGADKINGGRALSELIIFTRTLSHAEVLAVKSYLKAKWKGIAAVTIDATTVPSEVKGYDSLTLGADASFVYTDAVFGGMKAAPVNVWGTFDKTAAGKVRIAYEGHVWNRKQALFCVAAGGLSLEDFELTDFPPDATITCDGQTLWMHAGGSAAESPILADATTTGPRLWLDASKSESFVTNATGGVLTWKDRSPNANNATNYVFEGAWKYPTVGMTNDVTALIMGSPGSGTDLAFTYMDDIRTVFWVMDIDQNPQASFLGTYTNGWEKQIVPHVDNYDQQRRQSYMRSTNGRAVDGVARNGFFMFCTPDQVYGGQMLEDGVFPKDTGFTSDTELRWISPHSGLHVFSHRVKDDVPAWANNLGRCMGNNSHSAGKNLSELVIFNRSLTDAEIAEVTMQLRTKWQADSEVTKFVKETTITEPSRFGTLVFDRESTGQNLQTEASVLLRASALTSGEPGIKVFGELRRGEIATMNFTWAGDEIAVGTYTILECQNLFNCTKDGFVFNGFPDNAYLYWEGTSLKVSFVGPCEPLLPRVLSASGEAAPWLWLDASEAGAFTTNGQGGVTKWADKGARGNDATAYLIGETQRYGTVGTTNGVSAYLMGECGSGIDLAFARTTTARTMFWVMDIAMTRGSETGYYADFLGDSEKLNFTRGSTGQYSGTAAAQKGWTSGTILEDGDIPHDKKTHPEYGNFQLKPYAPPAVHVYSLQAADDMAACYLSAELGSSTEATMKCNGGRALSELVIFNRVLTAAEFNAVEAYLDLKWRGKTVEVAERVDATSRVSYPNLILDDGAGFVVNARTLVDGGEAAVTVYGRLVKPGEGKIRIENAVAKAHKDAVLLRCAASINVDLNSFDFVGFPEGTAFMWTGSELKIATTPTSGLLMIVR